MNEKARAMLEKENGKYTVNDLLTIMTLLRAEDGCPWDREQTHESIRKNLIEETYEVVEAIDNADMPLMREELGDLLLQVVFHAEIASEEGAFTFGDVTDEVCRKLIVRHPHIFAEVKADTSEAVLSNWDAIKEETKHRDSAFSVLDSVTKAMPSLMRAQKISKKAKKAGYPDSLHVIVGDMLYAACALCEENGIDAEKALYDACERKIESVAKEETDKENEN